MLIPNHPDDERLSALASHDADAAADTKLTSHVSSCDRCAALVNELGALRAVLADLPDVAPSRPLRLIPPVEDAPASSADRLGGWARRFFAPVLASGAALALVGAIGTAGPAFTGQASAPAGADSAAGGAPAAEEFAAQSAASEPELGVLSASPTEEATRNAADAAAAPAPTEPASGGEAAAEATAASEPASDGEAAPAPSVAEPSGDGSTLGAEDDDSGTGAERPVEQLAVERSPWPMILFAGVALMVGALLLRWILVPRPG